MPHDPSQQKVEQEEVRTSAGWDVPVEVVVSPSEIKDLKGKENASISFGNSFAEMLIPDARYSDLEGKTGQQDYATIGLKSLTPVEQRGMRWNQSIYLSPFDILGAIPGISFLGGLGQGLYLSRRMAEDRVRKNLDEVGKAALDEYRGKNAKSGEGNASVGTSQEGSGDENASVDIRSELEFYNARLEDVERLALSRSLNEDARIYGGRARESLNVSYTAPSDSNEISPEKNHDVEWS